MIVIDRFEDDLVVLEIDKKAYVLPRSLFPENAEERDVVNINISVDKEETAKILKRMEELQNEILRISEKNEK